MSKVLITRSLLDDLAESISAKSGDPVPLTLTEMKDAVDSIQTGGTPTLQTITKSYTPTESQQTETITAGSGYDGIEEVDVTVGAISSSYVGTGITRRSSTDLTASGATVTVPSGYYSAQASKAVPNATIDDSGVLWDFKTVNNQRVCDIKAGFVFNGGYIDGLVETSNDRLNAVPQNTTVTPSTSSQTIGGANYMMEGAVTVAAMPSGTAGTPTATKGAVSNHSVSVTPSVTNTAGYITGSTKTGTAVTVSASELVSGTYTVDSSGTKDVTNYASASVPAGTAGTPSASKGAVSNHSVSVTPSVTNTTGWITGSTKTGTAVTVSASELVSGNLPITQNGNNIDCANYSTVSVNVSGGGGTSKNVQVVQGTTRTTSSTMTAIGAEMTVSKTGTYDVYWSAFRSNTSSQYTFATQLYVGGAAYGSEQTTWSNHQQNVHLSNVSLTVNQKIRVYGRESRGSSYYMYAGTLTIVEA